MAIVLFLLFGLVVGVIARAIMPGKQSMSLIMTSLLGVGGSFVGGAVSSLLFHYRLGDMHPAGFVFSVVGALIILSIAGFVSKNRQAA